MATAEYQDQKDDKLAMTSRLRLLLALLNHKPSARTLADALSDVFPWACHLTSEEVRAFAVELVEVFSDAADLHTDATTQEVITGWRGTARIKADYADYVGARKPTNGDFGSVTLPA